MATKECMTSEEAYEAIRTITNCLRRLPEGEIKSTALPLAERIFNEIEESRKQYEQRTEQQPAQQAPQDAIRRDQKEEEK